jgi:hypothetical protein
MGSKRPVVQAGNGAPHERVSSCARHAGAGTYATLFALVMNAVVKAYRGKVMDFGNARNGQHSNLVMRKRGFNV